MQVDALLCDAATVREGLLHVLGGGVTRTWHDGFPAPLIVALAMMMTMPANEAGEHRVRIVLQDQDGKTLVTVDGGFEVAKGAVSKMGEHLAVPLAIPLHGVVIPKAGTYSLEVLVDGHHIRSLSFASVLRGEAKG